jgi:hypothetical protein
VAVDVEIAGAGHSFLFSPRAAARRAARLLGGGEASPWYAVARMGGAYTEVSVCCQPRLMFLRRVVMSGTVTLVEKCDGAIGFSAG